MSSHMAMILGIIALFSLIAITYAWYNEIIPEWVISGGLVVVALIALIFVDEPPGVVLIILLVGIGVLFKNIFYSKDWGHTEIIAQSDDGEIQLMRQEAPDGSERWAVGITTKDLPDMHFLDKNGNIADKRVFFDSEESASETMKTLNDPLVDTEIKSSKISGSGIHPIAKIILLVGVVVFFAAGYIQYTSSGPVPEMVSSDQISHQTALDEFQVTIENSGSSGRIEVKMYWIPTGDIPRSNSELPENPEQQDWALHQTKTVYFDSGERRTVSFRGELPVGYDAYQFIAEPAN